MAKCLNCNNDIAKGALKSNCPHCNYPQPTWSNKSFIISWCFFAFSFLLCGLLLSWVFLILLAIQSFFFFSMLRKRKYQSPSFNSCPKEQIEQEDVISSNENNVGTVKLSKSSQKRILKAKIKKEIKAEAKVEKKSNPVRSISYIPPSDDERKTKERDQYLKRNFETKLKALWSGSIDIEFPYSDANNDITYRSVTLNKVTINEYEEIYFIGICNRSGERRTFKAERIISDIEYNHDDYSLKQFFTKILNIGDKSQVLKEKNKKETFDIHFTGFRKADEERLIKLAQAKDLTVRKSITQNLQVLCIGYNASKNKIKQAKLNSISVMKEDELLHFLETGEILLRE